MVDAVADTPDLDAGSDVSAEQGTSAGLNITTDTTDTDGSENITMVQISGVPDGVTLSAGTNLGGGVWELAQSDLAGLEVNVDDSVPEGDYVLTVSSTATESVTDEECDLTNNSETVDDTLTLRVTEDDVPIIVDPAGICVDETDFSSVDPLVASGQLVADLGADGPGTYSATDASSFTSTTTFVHRLFPYFNEDKIIDNMMKGANWESSKYYGKTKQQINLQVARVSCYQ
mgnify:CR=1 FL=1